MSDNYYGAVKAITPGNTIHIPKFRALYVGTRGNVSVRAQSAANGNLITVIFTSVPAGTILNVKGDRVNSANTTATNIIALY